MTDPAVDLAKSILTLVGRFVSSLPADQLHALAAGEAQLKVVPKGARITGGSSGARGAAEVPAVSAFQVREDLAKIDDRAAAATYLKDLKLKADPLKKLSAELGVPPGKLKMDDVIKMIVETLVGRRIDGQSISRNASAGRY